MEVFVASNGSLAFKWASAATAHVECVLFRQKRAVRLFNCLLYSFALDTVGGCFRFDFSEII